MGVYADGAYSGGGLSFSEIAAINSNKNVLINGDFSIDQRNDGASQAITAGAAKAYTVDRWYAYCEGANVTGQRISGSGQNRYRYQFTGAASNTLIQFGQRIEAANSYHFNGQTVTLSVDLANSLLTTVTWTAYYANTTDTFGTIASPTRTQIATGTFTVTSTLDRYSTQIDIPSAATTGIEVVFSVANQTSGTWTIGNAQLELGAIATDFERVDLQDNFNACQRYARLSGAGWAGAEETSTTFGLSGVLPTMRSVPTLALSTSTLSYRVPSLAIDRTVTITSIIASGVSDSGGWFLLENSAGGNVAGRFIQERSGLNFLLLTSEL